MSTDNVIPFVSLAEAGTADAILDAAAGVFDRVLVVGWAKDGAMHYDASANFTDAKDLVFVLEALKAHVLASAFGGAQEMAQ
jgi:hypothetical protein